MIAVKETLQDILLFGPRSSPNLAAKDLLGTKCTQNLKKKKEKRKRKKSLAEKEEEDNSGCGKQKQNVRYQNNLGRGSIINEDCGT